jgi:hypothetical protein
MADTLYLSLWYPNLRLEALPDKLVAVLGAFAAHGGEAKVYSATVWPVSWNETPVFERIYGRLTGSLEPGEVPGAEPRLAVEEATELLHEDYAYEFQIGWNLWELETGLEVSNLPRKATTGPHSTSIASEISAQGRLSTRPTLRVGLSQDDNPKTDAQDDSPQTDHEDESQATRSDATRLDARWARGPRLVRVTGYGPLFDEGTYEQDGHIRIDFGSDAPFLEEDVDLSEVGARHIEENVRQLVELTTGVEKASGATARLLWSELGESLAQRLAARLGMEN